MFTAAFRTLDLALFVFRKVEDDFEWFLAIFAEKFVGRHDNPQSNSTNSFYSSYSSVMAAMKMTRQKAG
jgi:hypothetical protein